jgi:hypothetical protein
MPKHQNYLSLGQSNSEISLESEPGGLKIVRKRTTGDPRRLRFQYEKHLAAQVGPMEPLKVPRIVGEFNIDSYSMDFSPGIPLGFFLTIADRHEVQQINFSICDYFNSILHSASFVRNHLSESLKMKFNSILEQLALQPGDFDFVFHLVDSCLRVLPEIEIGAGWNHGDFSFENLLVDRDTLQVTAIDFLDSPFDSPYLDLGRYWLDANYGWWGAGLAPSANFTLNAKSLKQGALDVQKRSEMDPRVFPLFAGMAVARIVPYTKNPTRMAFLKNAAWRIGEDLK